MQREEGIRLVRDRAHHAKGIERQRMEDSRLKNSCAEKFLAREVSGVNSQDSQLCVNSCINLIAVTARKLPD